MPGVTPADVLSNFGITLVEDPAENQPRLLVDLPAAELVEHAIRREEGRMASNGALVIETGERTGRSPNDRFIVDTPDVHDKIAWGAVNRPLSAESYEAIKAGEALEAMGIHARIVNMSTIKPLDEELVLKCAKECGKIITCEEHSIIGGLGEAVCSVVSEKLPVPVRRIGVMDQFGHSGPANEVLRDYGLTADNIVNVIRDIVRPDAKA